MVNFSAQGPSNGWCVECVGQMGVRCFRSAFARDMTSRLAFGFAVAVLCGAGGCSCTTAVVNELAQPTGKASASFASTPAASYDYVPSSDTGADSYSEEVEVAAAPIIEPELLRKVAAPSCETRGSVQLSSDGSGINDEPHHETIARLESERDCYKRAERTVRLRLERLQKVLLENYEIESAYMNAVDAPSCEIRGVKVPPRGSGEPGATADPDLVRIARLQVVRDCYKTSEHGVRQNLHGLQRVYAQGLRT